MFSAVILVLMLMSAHLTAECVISIKIFSKTEIEKDDILLGEIGNITCEDQDLLQNLKKIVIGNAPLPGEIRRIDGNHIKFRLTQNGIKTSQICLFVPKSIDVCRSAIELSEEQIKKIVFSFLEKKLPWDKSRVKINNLRVSNDVILPKGNISYELIIPKNTELLGTTPLSIMFSVNGKFKKKVWVTVNIEVLTEVVVAKRPLGRYKIINESDVHLIEMDLAKLPSNVITNCEEILGKRTKRSLNAHEVLRTDLIELPPLVKRGDIVLIVAESEGLKVTALGKAKEKGRRGEMIRVLNIDSSKAIYARVLDSSRVKVDF